MSINHIAAKLALASALTFTVLCGTVQAELYLGAQVGYDFGGTLRNFQDIGPQTSLQNQTLDLQGAFLYGGKVGYFFPSIPWFGAEVELFQSNPAFKQRVFQQSGLGVDATEGHLRTTVAAVNLVLRYPSKRIQPYVGIGPGVFFFKFNSEGETENGDTKVGVNAFGGVRFFVSDSWALFTEYKFDYARVKFEPTFFEDGFGGRAKYIDHKIAVGISYHFKS